MHGLHGEPNPLAQRSSTMLLVSGGAGTLSSALSAVLPDPWKGWLHYASPWVAAMVAALWPDAWERFKWNRLRRQGMDTLDSLIVELKEFHGQAMSSVVRNDVMVRIHQLEVHRLRITAALPFMEVNVHGAANESFLPWRDTAARSHATPAPPSS